MMYNVQHRELHGCGNGYKPAGIPRERERILRKTRGNDGNGNDFCSNTVGTGPNFRGIPANTNSVHCDS